MTKDELQLKIESDLRNGKNIMTVAGAYGDTEKCEGFCETPIEPEEGGMFTKFYGCSYLFKGYPKQEIVEGMATAKAMISAIPRKILGKSLFWRVALFIRALFNRKRFIHDLHIWFLIADGIVWRVNHPYSKYNRLTKELRRASNKVLQRAIEKCSVIVQDWEYVKENRRVETKVLKKRIELSKEQKRLIKIQELPLLHHYWDLSTKREIWETIAKFLEFTYFFIEFDNAYRFRLQDILENLDKENLRKGVIRETRRLFKLLIRREIKGIGIDFKWKEIYYIIMGALVLSKDIRNFTREFLLELDLSQVRLDEDDWYFCLNRNSYNFRGWTYKDRLNEKKRLDKEKGHLKVELMQMTTELSNGAVQSEPGLRVREYEDSDYILI